MSKAKSWFHEKLRRDGKREPDTFPKERKTPSVKWRKKYKCKKNKGDHTFRVVSVRNWIEWEGKVEKTYSWLSGIMTSRERFEGATPHLRSLVKWECSACKKHETERFGGWSRYGSTKNKQLDKCRPGY